MRRKVIQNLAWRLGLGKIGDDRQGLDAKAMADLFGKGVEPVSPASSERQIVAVTGQNSGKSGSDSGRCSRHQRQFAFHHVPCS